MNLDFLGSMRSVHVLLGAGGFILGLVAILLPKFGKPTPWHRWIGRVYAVSMLGMAALSVPLALVSGSVFLMAIGLLTFGWVAGGWFAMRRYLHLRRNGVRGETSSRWLRSHLILMSASYIGAWTAFLVNIEPLGTGPIFYL